MRIVIPVENNEITTKVSENFGRAAYYLLYDDSNDKVEFIDNLASSSNSGAGIKAAQLIVDNQADVLITPRCGENAAEVLSSGNVKLYKAGFKSAQDNLTAFKAGELEELNEIHGGFHKHGN